MKAVSEAYQEGMLQTMRNCSYARVTMYVEDPSAANDGAWSSNGIAVYSSFSTVDYPFRYGGSYATLELNRWVLDGEQVVRPSSSSSYTPQGFVSGTMSNSAGVYSSPPMILRSFSQEHPLPGVSVTFDSRCEEWPRSVTAKFYRNDVVVETKTVTVTSQIAILTTTQDTIDGVAIFFNSGLPYRRARVEYVLFGLQMVYGSSEIISTSQEHDIDPLTRRLPQERASVQLLDFEGLYAEDNPLGLFRYVEDKARLQIQHGFTLSNGKIEWLLPDSYVLDGKPSNTDTSVTFSATGVINSLSGRFYKSKVGQKTLYNMAVEVLQDANLTPTYDGGDPWEIDDSLKTMYSQAVLPIDTHANCLQMIAHAARCVLYTDDENIIHIKPFSLSSLATKPISGTVDFFTVAEKTLMGNKTDKLKAVNVEVYTYNQAVSATKLYENTTTETTLHAELNNPASGLTISVTGGTLISYTIYGRAVDMVLSSGTKTVVINGYALEQTNAVLTLPISSTGEVDNEQNPLITNTVMAQALAQHTAAYLALRNTYDLSYRGNPEIETQDVVTLETKYNPEQRALVLVNGINYNGSLSGKLKLKGLT